MFVWRNCWLGLLAPLSGCFLGLLPGSVYADPIPGSMSPVGAWRVGAYTRGHTAVFDFCVVERTQRDGFAIALGYTPQGIWSLFAMAPDWGLTPNEVYTVSIVVGASAPFTLTGTARNPRMMSTNPAPELFDQLKSGVQLTASANQHRFTISLDGVEAAMARAKECTRQYASRTNVPLPVPPVPAPPSPAQPGGPSAVATQPAPNTPPAADGRRDVTTVSSGTGFYVGRNTVITNFHVINGCETIYLGKNGAGLGGARVVVASQGDDLAALHTNAETKSFLKLRVGAQIRPAESVLVFGYPLSGALSSAGNTTLGNVTALTGLHDDSRYIQISAAVQPGNSGGPVIDESGRLMGVVVSKLNAAAVARATGDIPQNVNFAIKASTLASFLEAHNIAYESDGNTQALSNTERAGRAEAGSMQIVCRKRASR